MLNETFKPMKSIYEESLFFLFIPLLILENVTIYMRKMKEKHNFKSIHSSFHIECEII